MYIYIFIIYVSFSGFESQWIWLKLHYHQTTLEGIDEGFHIFLGSTGPWQGVQGRARRNDMRNEGDKCCGEHYGCRKLLQASLYEKHMAQVNKNTCQFLVSNCIYTVLPHLNFFPLTLFPPMEIQPVFLSQIKWNFHHKTIL